MKVTKCILVLIILNVFVSIYCRIMKQKLMRTKTTTKKPFFFTHEIPIEYAMEALTRGLLVSTSLLVGDTSQELRTGRNCGPVIFVRVVSDIALGKLNEGSNGSSASVIFVFNPEAATEPELQSITEKKLEGYAKDITEEEKEVFNLRVNKLCYVWHSDFGGKGSKAIEFYQKYDHNKIYSKAIPPKNVGEKAKNFMQNNNESTFGIGITLNDHNLRYIIFKVFLQKNTSSSTGNPCLMLKPEIKVEERSPAPKVEKTKEEEKEDEKSLQKKVEAVNSYFKSKSHGWAKKTTNEFGAKNSCILFMKSKGKLDESIYVDERIKNFYDNSDYFHNIYRVMAETDPRKNIMKLD